MAIDFWDTSGLAKLYVPERGSAWASARATSANVSISGVAVVEVASVFRRRFSEGSISDAEREDLYARFLRDAVRFEVVDVTPRILALSSELLLAGGTGARVRSLDAIQLASVRWWFEQAAAINIDPGAFIVADRPLREAAVALGLPVENPEDYE